MKGWNEIRDTDLGLLWEHLVLDMLRVSYGNVSYWLDKEKNEIDFVVKGEGEEIHAIECKINPEKFSPKTLLKFRSYYPRGKNFCFSPHIRTPYKLSFEDAEVVFQSVVSSFTV